MTHSIYYRLHRTLLSGLFLRFGCQKVYSLNLLTNCSKERISWICLSAA